jgi:hypothetical protein
VWLGCVAVTRGYATGEFDQTGPHWMLYPLLSTVTYHYRCGATRRRHRNPVRRRWHAGHDPPTTASSTGSRTTGLKFGQASQGHLNEYERPGPGWNRPSPSRRRPSELTGYLLPAPKPSPKSPNYSTSAATITDTDKITLASHGSPRSPKQLKSPDCARSSPPPVFPTLRSDTTPLFRSYPNQDLAPRSRS